MKYKTHVNLRFKIKMQVKERRSRNYDLNQIRKLKNQGIGKEAQVKAILGSQVKIWF